MRNRPDPYYVHLGAIQDGKERHKEYRTYHLGLPMISSQIDLYVLDRQFEPWLVVVKIHDAGGNLQHIP